MRRPLHAVAPVALLLTGCLFVASPPDREYPEPDTDVPARAMDPRVSDEPSVSATVLAAVPAPAAAPVLAVAV